MHEFEGVALNFITPEFKMASPMIDFARIPAARRPAGVKANFLKAVLDK